MKRRIVLIFLTIFFVSGCSQEPLISLSEERQAEIAALEEQKESKNDLESQSGSFNKADFESHNDDVVFEDISAFIPVQPNQMSIFSKENTTMSLYLDFVDSSLSRLQVREVENNQVTNYFYEWNQDSLTRLLIANGSLLPVNQLQTINEAEFSPYILIASPIQKGTTWNADDETTAEITQLYKTTTILNHEYQDVVEVTYRKNNFNEIYYFAKGVGLIASIQEENNQSQYVQLSEIAQNKLFETSITVFNPQQTDDRIRLIEENHSMMWQTNDSLAAIYTRLFQQLGWINETSSINSISVENDIVVIDFTSGVVAAFNQHPLTETGVIPAIITTIGKHYNVDQVALTVDGLGLLPDILSYPVGGIWNVNQEWFN